MKIETRIIGEIRILDCSGKITLGEGTMAVRNTVRDILKSDGKKIRELLAITKLLTVFQVFEDEKAALDSFS